MGSRRRKGKGIERFRKERKREGLVVVVRLLLLWWEGGSGVEGV